MIFNGYLAMSTITMTVADICMIVAVSSVLGFIYGRIFRSSIEREMEDRIYDLRRHVNSMKEWIKSSNRSHKNEPKKDINRTETATDLADWIGKNQKELIVNGSATKSLVDAIDLAIRNHGRTRH